jgi:hypothetical protein
MPHRDAPKGHCRWCGDLIFREDGQINLRRRWHEHCVNAYKEAAWPRFARRLLYKRDKGVCAICSLKLRKGWHLDHIVPLVDGGAFDLSNMQTLCPDCHRQKTAQEATQRAKSRQRVAVAEPEEAVASVETTQDSVYEESAGPWMDIPEGDWTADWVGGANDAPDELENFWELGNSA